MANCMAKNDDENTINSTAICLSAQAALAVDNPAIGFFAAMNCPRNAAIWRAVLILLIRQTSGSTSRISDLFPQQWVSDRTRILYARQMQRYDMVNAETNKKSTMMEFKLTPAKVAELIQFLENCSNPD
jgi:hypothetical protein